MKIAPVLLPLAAAMAAPAIADAAPSQLYGKSVVITANEVSITGCSVQAGNPFAAQ